MLPMLLIDLKLLKLAALRGDSHVTDFYYIFTQVLGYAKRQTGLQQAKYLEWLRQY